MGLQRQNPKGVGQVAVLCFETQRKPTIPNLRPLSLSLKSVEIRRYLIEI